MPAPRGVGNGELELPYCELDCEDADRTLVLVLPDRAEYESGPFRPDVEEDPPEGEHVPEEYA
eukprot:8987763-Pyramimonas_sp.AAC.1